jgi:hypothetical protein
VAQIFIAHDPRRPERHAPRTSRARRRLSRVLHGRLNGVLQIRHKRQDSYLPQTSIACLSSETKVIIDLTMVSLPTNPCVIDFVNVA